ncbi:serine/threonine protein kinase [Arthrobacter agilis]|uniref:serine/threonine-protein kinase n=2 Tax=Micrococcaceae TaxID=1268 RepID=UPI000B34B52F|nr:serine/threonine-protein kinase [Arthrobacter agilis]OUM44127.1 serine/threonine protein kinase [Arthrobacter agilis]PPB46502.1 serine/threonine protein kinase [Arthrobacter agilis]TPV23842.1 serine/threonine protein kinase [Arthrobacter agilis]VDR32578.1 Serine/threonine-protein kinase pknB [Arthrobacter agilis]
MDVLLADRYQTTALLGVGGAASVYRATDHNLGRDVAVKVFNPTTADDDNYRRQHTETMLLSTLNHPGLVTLHDAGMHVDPEGRTTGFLVMELVDGEDLRHLLKRGPLPAEDVAQLGADLADALAYIHSEGVVHRDVKPANILMFHSGDNGTRLYPKLTDFGIARMVDATMATAVGATIGTANYLSPEQAKGDSLDERSDIYSLGLVLLECLTGEKAFPGPVVEAALARLLRDPEVPDSLGPDWSELLSRMTARDPEQRPFAHDVALRLRRHDDEHPAPASAAAGTRAAVETGTGRRGDASGEEHDAPTGDSPTGGVMTGGVVTGNIHIPEPPQHAPSVSTRPVS